MAMTPDELAADLDEERGTALGDVVRNLQCELAKARDEVYWLQGKLKDQRNQYERMLDERERTLRLLTGSNSKKSD